MPDVVNLAPWDNNVTFFTKDAMMFLYEFQTMKELSKIDLREKVDFYTMDTYGRLHERVKDHDFLVISAKAHGNMPVIAMMTKDKELIVYDIQKDRVINYLHGHCGKIKIILTDSKSRTNFFTLGEDNKLIFWRFSVDKWIPRVYNFEKILEE
jgi:hypothetical protein